MNDSVLGEAKEFLRRIADKLSALSRKNTPQFTRFLTPAERDMAQSWLRANGAPACAAVGGFEESERAVLYLMPDWMEELPGWDELPVTVICAKFSSGYYDVSHRDVLGALMGLGIARDTVGDIRPGEEPGVIYAAVLSELAPYILENLTSAGRAPLSLSTVSPADVRLRPEKFTAVRSTVASLRLDSIVASGFAMSREKAAALIKTGRVSLGHTPCLKPDAPVQPGYSVSVRGMGKLVLTSADGVTRKGRIPVEIKRYS